MFHPWFEDDNQRADIDIGIKKLVFGKPDNENDVYVVGNKANEWYFISCEVPGIHVEKETWVYVEPDERFNTFDGAKLALLKMLNSKRDKFHRASQYVDNANVEIGE